MNSRRNPAILTAAAALFLATTTFAAETLRIENGRYTVEYEPSTFTLRASANGAETPFISHAVLSQPLGTATVITVSDRVWGSGEGIEIEYSDGSKDWAVLYPELPFIVMQTILSNGAAVPATVNRLQTAILRLDLEKPAYELKALGTGGLSALAGAGSYSFLAVADPETRAGVVTGWLTHNRGSGVVFGETSGDSPIIRARLDFGRLLLEPGSIERLEPLLVGYFGDARLGLEAYADAIAKQYNIQLPPQPAVYCTWYHSRASDEKEIAVNTAFAAEHLKPYGLSVMQIDDGWQSGVKDNGPKKDFTQVDPNGPYPSGMKKTAGMIRSKGMVPGIWYMPFAGTWDDPWFADKQDLFATKDGKPFEVFWGGTCLDTTNPKTQSYIRDIARRIAHDWGYEYFKLDGLWTGTATKIRYINYEYLEDDFGESVLHDPEKTHIEAYRDGLKIVREAAGDEVFLLGCNISQNARTLGGSFGLLDAMRIGPDNGRKWTQMVRGPRSGSMLYFLHGRVWYNDPDPIYVRDSVPLEHARTLASWVALTGQLNASSTDYAKLSPERLELLRRTMPAHTRKPRPVDLFEERLPRVWLLENDESDTFRSHVIGLFNWEENESATIRHSLKEIGLDPRYEYVGFDYWANKFLGPLPETLEQTLPGAACRIISVRRNDENRPIVVSTSRHVAQGAVDMIEEFWYPGPWQLTGKSAVVGGDPYELRIWCPDGYQAAGVKVTDASGKSLQATQEQSGNELRVHLSAPSNTNVRWTVSF